MSSVTNIFHRFSKTNRNLRKDMYKQEKRQWRHRIESTKDKIEHTTKYEHPRQLAFQKQAMFGRGLGKSTIYEQEKARLSSVQSRQMAALQRELDIANSGYQLVRKRQRAARRAQWIDTTSDVIGAVMTGFTFGMAAAGTGSGGGGGGGTTWGGGNQGPVNQPISYGPTSGAYYYT